MIIWGGDTIGVNRNDGAAYDPVTNTWTAVSTAGAPSPRSRHTAVWTGSNMIVWGGLPGPTNAGAVYDPATDAWTPTAMTRPPGP